MQTVLPALTRSRSRFQGFTRAPFGAPGLTEAGFRQIVQRHVPDAAEDLRIWLETTGYPDAFRIDR